MRASSEPLTSALMIRLSVAASRWIWSKMSSSLAPPARACASVERRLTLPVLTGVGHPAGHLLIRRDDELGQVGDLGEART